MACTDAKTEPAGSLGNHESSQQHWCSKPLESINSFNSLQPELARLAGFKSPSESAGGPPQVWLKAVSCWFDCMEL
eukprot:scaffold42671_cov19-Tisochrysis_lutea.AAC.2